MNREGKNSEVVKKSEAKPLERTPGKKKRRAVNWREPLRGAGVVDGK